MALFKIFKGSSANLPLGTKAQLVNQTLPYQEGFAYFTPDTGRFYIDAGDERIALNAGNISFHKTATANTDGSNLDIGIGSDTKRNPRVWVPAATDTLSGVLTTSEQTIAGGKTFKDWIYAESGIQAGGTVGPKTTNKYSLGSSTSYWSAIYATNIYGKFATARNLKVNLASTTAQSFDGSADASSIGVSGILPVANGGTGASTGPVAGGIIYGKTTSAYACTAVGTAGQLLVSNGASTPGWIDATVESASGSIVKRNINGDFSAGTITAAAFVGKGGSLTELNASNISQGTLAAARLATSGVTAGSYGPASNASPGMGKTFSVPYITVDIYGRVTAASTKTITLPSYGAFSGASATGAGVMGLVPAPTAGQQNYFLRGNGTWYNLTDLDGTALDTFSELKAAWESGDGTLKSTLDEAINKKVTKAGDIMTGDLTFSSEKSTKYKIERKNASGGGWAYAPVQVIGNNDGTFFRMGVYGQNDALTYGFIGANSNTANNNLHIYPNGNIGFGTADYLSIINPSNTANTTFYLPNTGGTLITHPSRGISVGDANNPVYIASTGVATKGNKYGGGTAVTLNGTSKAASTASFYAAETVGTSGYILKSNGSGAPTWLQTLPVTNGGTGRTSWATMAATWTDGTTNGPKLTITDSVGRSVTSAALPAASTTTSGIITTTTQNITGNKIFHSSPCVSAAGAGSDGAQYFPAIEFIRDGNQANKIGRIYFDVVSASNATLIFQINDGSSSYSNKYQFPRLTSALSKNTTYEILTTQNRVTVAQGGTGASTFASGEVLIGNGANAVTTRGINNMTTKGYIAYDTKLMTTNTLAYWNGAYSSAGASNLTYCNQGAFGNVVTKSYTDSSSASAIGTGTSVPTERDIYYGLPTINNSHSYTSSTTIYAPATGGTAGQVLMSAGSTSTPIWGMTLYSYTTSAMALSQNTWTNVATATNLGNPATGTYIIQITAGGAIYSGVMSWDASTTTASVYDEILLHSASSSGAHVTARVNRTSGLYLQVCALDASVASGTITIKMRQII